MGNRAHSTICLGIHVVGDEGVPWEAYEEEDWWLEQTGFVLPTEEGANRFAAKQEWLKSHPSPVEVVECGDDNEYDVILAIPGTVTSTDWDEPLQFDPNKLGSVGDRNVNDVLDAAAAFKKFTEAHGIEGTPVWLLSSYWG